MGLSSPYNWKIYYTLQDENSLEEATQKLLA